ncbi:MAG TPA: CDP-glycerol glycerophosphotransferase family protein [Solirubrobacteraceae bacterium]|nr:CDP-glycerol glycerophosphotransferase family protein [Solirubrobacteraceae bacterium]
MRFVYNSFEGRYSDSPRALYEALRARGGDHEHLWLADPAHAESFSAAGVATAQFATGEGLAAVEAADVLIANTHTDFAWTKRGDAVYLQTWHGTPLKRIHWDVLWAPPGRLERLSGDVERWDLLISPNRASTPLLRGAFRYDGEVLESGYPRNDVLSAPGRDDIRAAVRADLGIPDGRTVVLYAPTWRDAEVFGPDEAPLTSDFCLAFDVDAFTQHLGGDHVLLLRLHYMLTHRFRAAEHEAVRDVSFYADISRLYLAADVLVTDYSSVMFDFAITGRPILFFTYDLDDYRDRARGFYFDFTPVAPGPLLTTTQDVLDALRGLPAVNERYADAYARFRERFCHLEDGHASDRVLDRLLGERGG